MRGPPAVSRPHLATDAAASRAPLTTTQRVFARHQHERAHTLTRGETVLIVMLESLRGSHMYEYVYDSAVTDVVSRKYIVSREYG
jgi:hypothetical protein